MRTNNKLNRFDDTLKLKRLKLCQHQHDRRLPHIVVQCKQDAAVGRGRMILQTVKLWAK